MPVFMAKSEGAEAKDFVYEGKVDKTQTALCFV